MVKLCLLDVISSMCLAIPSAMTYLIARGVIFKQGAALKSCSEINSADIKLKHLCMCGK